MELKSVSLVPNPVFVGQSFVVSAALTDESITEIDFGCRIISPADGAVIDGDSVEIHYVRHGGYYSSGTKQELSDDALESQRSDLPDGAWDDWGGKGTKVVSFGSKKYLRVELYVKHSDGRTMSDVVVFERKEADKRHVKVISPKDGEIVYGRKVQMVAKVSGAGKASFSLGLFNSGGMGLPPFMFYDLDMSKEYLLEHVFEVADEYLDHIEAYKNIIDATVYGKGGKTPYPSDTTFFYYYPDKSPYIEILSPVIDQEFIDETTIPIKIKCFGVDRAFIESDDYGSDEALYAEFNDLDRNLEYEFEHEFKITPGYYPDIIIPGNWLYIRAVGNYDGGYVSDNVTVSCRITPPAIAFNQSYPGGYSQHLELYGTVASKFPTADTAVLAFEVEWTNGGTQRFGSIPIIDGTFRKWVDIRDGEYKDLREAVSGGVPVYAVVKDAYNKTRERIYVSYKAPQSYLTLTSPGVWTGDSGSYTTNASSFTLEGYTENADGNIAPIVEVWYAADPRFVWDSAINENLATIEVNPNNGYFKAEIPFYEVPWNYYEGEYQIYSKKPGQDFKKFTLKVTR